jgi:hypothetical protein
VVRLPAEVTHDEAVFAVAAAIDGRPVDPASDPVLVIEGAIAHRVSGLLARSSWARALSADQTALVFEDARLAALHAELLDRELRDVLPRLTDRRVSALVTKGAHLAHAIYPDPALRQRADTDLLVSAGEKSVTADALAALGYTRSVRTTGSVILGQLAFERVLRAGVTHYIDLHWRAAAPLLFERAFDAGVLLQSSEPIAALGHAARGPSLPDALALSCVHLIAHHRQQMLLVWLNDIRLLANALDAGGLRRLAEAAVAGRYTVIVHASLRAARQYFESDGLDRAIECVAPCVDESEPSAALVRDGRRPVDDLWLDLRYARWPERARLLREHVLPPADYMRARFSGPVPLAYVKRLVRGVGKWF